MFSMLESFVIYEHCENKVEKENMKIAEKVLKICSEQIECINTNPSAFAGDLIENLTKLTGKSWVLSNEDDYYRDRFDIKIACIENKNDSFYIRNSRAWFAGTPEKSSVRDLYLTVPLEEDNTQKFETYCDLAEVLEVGLFNYDREKIEQNLSIQNTLYQQIPELSKAVNESMFNEDALQDLREKDKQNSEQMFL